MRLTRILFSFVLMLSILVLIPSAFVAQAATLDEVVNSNTPAPGGTGTFAGFSSGTPIGSGDLAFVASDGDELGIFAYNRSSRTIEKLVGESDFNITLTTVTNSEVTTFRFLSFSSASITQIGDGDFAFGGTFGPTGDPFTGIWTYIDGELSLVADSNLIIPGGDGFPDRFDDLSHIFSYLGNDHQISFTGKGTGDFFYRGVYIYDIATQQRFVVADTNTALPGSPGLNFTGFNGFSQALPLANGGFVFRAFIPHQQGNPFNYGFFGHRDGEFFRIIDTSRIYRPDNTGGFTDIGNPVLLESGNIIFPAHYDDGLVPKTEIYLYNITDGSLTLLIDEITTEFPPGGPVVHPYFGSFDLRNVVSLGNGDDFAIQVNYDGFESGIYSYTDGTLARIADSVNTLIPGDTINFRYFTDLVSLNNGGIAFAGGRDFRDIRGIYGSIGGFFATFADLSDVAGFGTHSTGLKAYGVSSVSFKAYNQVDIDFIQELIFSDPSLYVSSLDSGGGNASPFNLTFLGIPPATSSAINTIDFQGANPNQRIIITWGFNLQADTLSSGPCAGASSDIKNPRIFRTRPADSSGNLNQAVFVPASFAGVSVVVQGITEDTCQSSNAGSVTFE